MEIKSLIKNKKSENIKSEIQHLCLYYYVLENVFNCLIICTFSAKLRTYGSDYLQKQVKNKTKQQKQTEKTKQNKTQNNNYNITMTWIHLICNKTFFNLSMFLVCFLFLYVVLIS